MVHRVVSLVGMGGVGKTRLALVVARTAVLDFPDGVWLVELGSVTDGRLVAGTVAASIGLASSPRRPVIETLIAAFGSSRVLLVLDNCEHLVQACAELVEVWCGVVRTFRFWLRVASRSAYLARSPGRSLRWLRRTKPCCQSSNC